MAAPPPPPPDPAPVLIDDIVGEFLLRLPPEDPAVLACAALVSRQWHGVITGPVFRRKFREFHRSPPFLGYISNIGDSIRFVPTSSFRPPHAHADRRGVIAVHASHGRVLLQQRSAGMGRDVFLSVWDPVTDEQRDLPVVPLPPTPGPWRSNWDAAVICAAAGDGCNHVHCHFKFKVVFVGWSQGRNFSCLYSSQADSWSDPVFPSMSLPGYFITGTCVHVGSALYFLSGCNQEIVKCDLLTNLMSNICARVGPSAGTDGMATVLIATEDGRLGVAKTSNSTLNSTLHLWIRECGRWEERRAIELPMLLPDNALRDPRLPPEAFVDKPWLAGFAKIGAGGVIFFKTRVGYFSVDLNSGRSNNIGECLGWGCIFPYVSFCTPAPGAISSDKGPGDAVFTDEDPGAVLSSE